MLGSKGLCRALDEMSARVASGRPPRYTSADPSPVVVNSGWSAGRRTCYWMVNALAGFVTIILCISAL